MKTLRFREILCALCAVLLGGMCCAAAEVQARDASGAASAAPGAAEAAPRGQQQQRWANPQPDVPYLPKPATRPADWIVEHDPATPDASPEARSLLKFLYSISGKHTLTGQHNYAVNQGRFTDQARRTTGKTPALYGTDWGSSQREIGPGRDRIVQALIREHQRGSIIALCWHEVRPIDSEPNTFQQSVKAKLSETQWNELLTPGSPLNQRWLDQVDVAAGRFGGGRGPTTRRVVATAQGSGAGPTNLTGPTTRRSGPQVDVAAMVKDPRMWSLEDSGYLEAIAPIRAASGLSATRPAVVAPPQVGAGR
ncbi:MAG: glycosyl hydrolase [Planctomycetota bacterium]|nr:glycosyl hydrolase [Planctomycetota bacterium]